VKFRDIHLKFFQKTETISEVLILANHNKGNLCGADPLKRPILKFHARRSFDDLSFERDEKSCRRVLAWRACTYSQYRVGLVQTSKKGILMESCMPDYLIRQCSLSSDAFRCTSMYSTNTNHRTRTTNFPSYPCCCCHPAQN
jgi:hypothetical protein